MKITRFTAAFVALLFTVSLPVLVMAADNDPVTVAGILNAAKCPLTPEQAKIITDYKPGEGGREARQALYAMFDEKQMAALKSKLGVMPARNERPETVRSLFQVIVLEKEGISLTEKQVTALKDLPMGQGMFQSMNEIYTDKQRETMQKYGGRRGGGGGGGGGAGGNR